MKVTQGCPFSWDGRDLNRRTKSLKVSTDFCQRTWRQRQSFFCSSPLMTKERTGKRPLSGKGPQSFHKCKSSINFANQSASRYCAEKFEACFLAVRVLASRAQTRLSEVPFNLRFMKYTCSDMTFYWISFPANQLKLSSTSKRNREEPSYECEGIERKKRWTTRGKKLNGNFPPYFLQTIWRKGILLWPEHSHCSTVSRNHSYRMAWTGHFDRISNTVLLNERKFRFHSNFFTTANLEAQEKGCASPHSIFSWQIANLIWKHTVMQVCRGSKNGTANFSSWIWYGGTGNRISAPFLPLYSVLPNATTKSIT